MNDKVIKEQNITQQTSEKPVQPAKIEPVKVELSAKSEKTGKPAKETQKKEPQKVDYSELVSEGMNLIPPMAKAEVQLEENKGKFNVGAALAILILVVVSIAIIAYNTFQKQQLNTVLTEKAALEKQVKAYEDVIYKNNKLNERVQLYTELQRQAISYDEVFTYWQQVSENLAMIKSIQLGDDMSFEVSGESDSLMDVAKLWHFLSIDDKVLDVNLESFGKGAGVVSFDFTGTLNSEYFTGAN